LLTRFGYDVQPLSLEQLVQGGPCPGLLVACTLGLTQQELAALNQALASHPDSTLVMASSQARSALDACGTSRCRLCNTPVTPIQLREALQALETEGVDAAGIAEYDLDVPPSPISQTLRVLVAEDNPVNQMVVRGLLEKRGCLVKLVPNGLDALSAYRAHPDQFQLILMDGEMPIMDGFEATRQIRTFERERLLPAVTIVALTAHILDSHRQAGADAGMDDYLAKPLKRDALYAVIDRLLKPDKAR
jgi:CheY-like chemotaxis protein